MLNEAKSVVSKLIYNGFEAYFIGGSVRNGIHNKFHSDNLAIKDIDIVTNASFEDVSKIFNNVEPRGEQFKVAVVKYNGVEFEVAQYRGDVYPEEGSLRPEAVYVVDTLEEDVKRRDFTVNGIAESFKGEIIDYVGGEEDIKNKVIRAIGDADKRFSEDPLRILRAFRFVSQLGYNIEKETIGGILKNSEKLAMIPHERVAGEMIKILKGSYIEDAFRLMKAVAINFDTFYNSIDKKQVNLLDRVFTLSNVKFFETMRRVKCLSMVDVNEVILYAALYWDVDWEEASGEMKDSMFLSVKDISYVTILLKHKDLIFDQTPEKLLEVLKDMKGDMENRNFLIWFIETLEMLSKRDLSEARKFLSRVLFKSELSFRGEDVISEGKKYGFEKPGPWVAKVIEKARDNGVLGKPCDLNPVIDEVLVKSL